MEQSASDVAVAIGGDGGQAPGPAATSIDPVIAAKQALADAEAQQAQAAQAAQVPPGQAQPVPAEAPTPGGGVVPVQPPQSQPVPIQVVAPNAPGSQPFVNPDPSSAINEPPKFDPQTGQPIAVVAPANQPAPISPQLVAQQEAEKEASEPPTVAELAEAANLCRASLAHPGGSRVATLLDRVAESRIASETQAASGQPQFDPNTGARIA